MIGKFIFIFILIFCKLSYAGIDFASLSSYVPSDTMQEYTGKPLKAELEVCLAVAVKGKLLAHFYPYSNSYYFRGFLDRMLGSLDWHDEVTIVVSGEMQDITGMKSMIKVTPEILMGYLKNVRNVKNIHIDRKYKGVNRIVIVDDKEIKVIDKLGAGIRVFSERVK